MREQRICPGARSSISTRLLRDPLCGACSTFCGAKPLLAESASARTAPAHPSSQKSPGLWQLQRQQQIESRSSLPATEIRCEDELLDMIPLKRQLPQVSFTIAAQLSARLGNQRQKDVRRKRAAKGPSLLSRVDEVYWGCAGGWPASPEGGPPCPPCMCSARRCCIFCWSASNFCFC
jgi:hypothetical protein